MLLSEKSTRRLVPTVERTFSILESLANGNQGKGVSELSRELGFAKSTTFNILTTLEDLGYIYRTDNRYHLSLKLFSLSSTVVQQMDLRKVAAPILQNLVEKTGETVNLGTIQDDEAVYIDCLPGPQPVTVHTWPGERLSLHSTALGKVLLAWMPEDAVESILTHKGMPQHTSATASSTEQLIAELRQVRQDGYAVDDEEDAPGMRCVGAPVFDHTGQVIAAVSITAPVQRLTKPRIETLAQIVVDAARRISRRLGHKT